jgi:iron complex transport system ATP-binding protein
MSAPSLLSVRGLLWRTRRGFALGPLDLEIERGRCLVLVGPNGAGKTTLLRCLTGLLAPLEGQLHYGAEDLRSLSRRELARRIAYVPQTRPARVPLAVGELVLLGRYPYLSPLRLAPRPEDFAAVDKAMELVGIEGLRERAVDELSGGERQAVYIAAALAQESELLVLDEPTLHLDAGHQRDLAALLLRLKAEAGRTVVMATHDLNLASLLGDHLVGLSAGRILASGPPAEIVEPEVLHRLFGARFAVVRAGERPATLLELGA